MLGVPLKAMCSNMWASPVMPGTSWAEPTSATVAKEKTGAVGRSTMMNVQPFGRTWTLVFASKDARSWAARGAAAARVRRSSARAARVAAFRFMVGSPVWGSLTRRRKPVFSAGSGAGRLRRLGQPFPRLHQGEAQEVEALPLLGGARAHVVRGAADA